MKRLALTFILLLLGNSVVGVAQSSPVVGLASKVTTRDGQANYSVPPAEIVVDNLPMAPPTRNVRQQSFRQAALEKLMEARQKDHNRTLPQTATGQSPANNRPAGENAIFSAFAGKDFAGISDAYTSMAFAVGPKYILQAQATSLLIVDKNGIVQPGYSKDILAFLGLPATDVFGAAGSIRAFYDWANGRFVVVGLATSIDSNSFLTIAASKTSDPRGTWYSYGRAFQVGPSGARPVDFTAGNDHTPWIGSTKGAVYAGADFNTQNGSEIGQNYMFLLPKDYLYKGRAFPYWVQFGFNVGGVLVDTMQPLNASNTGSNPSAAYVVNSFFWNFNLCLQQCNGLVVWAISNPFGFINGGPSPEFSGVFVPTAHNYSFPWQEFTPCCALTNISGTSIDSSVQYNAGSLFAALETADTVRNTTENSPLWFELHPVLGGSNPRCSGAFANACPDLASVEMRQEDSFVCGGWSNGGSADLAALQPDADNNLTMVFTFSSFSDQPGVAYTSRRVDYPASLMNGAGTTSPSADLATAMDGIRIVQRPSI